MGKEAEIIRFSPPCEKSLRAWLKVSFARVISAKQDENIGCRVSPVPAPS